MNNWGEDGDMKWQWQKQTLPVVAMEYNKGTIDVVCTKRDGEK